MSDPSDSRNEKSKKAHPSSNEQDDLTVQLPATSEPEESPSTSPLNTMTLNTAEPQDTESAHTTLERKLSSPNNRYSIQSFLGEGGMGEVYEAKDGTLERRVAVKFLREKFSNSEQGRAQFWNEALNSSVLDHPNIPPLFDLNIDHRGRPFYVMRCIEGKTLEEVIKGPEQERWGTQRLVAAIIQVCGALQFAHDKNILHLDIKPSNIMTGKYGEIYLLDWGISEKFEDSETTSQLQESHPTGSLRGTPAYMSPEQARANSKLSPTSDVFSLGILLFEVLIGRRPFKGVDTAETLKKIKSAIIEPCAAWENCAPDLQAILKQALKPAPEERYQSAKDLATALQSYADGHAEKLRKIKSSAAAYSAAQRELLDRDRLQCKAKEIKAKMDTLNPKPWEQSDQKKQLWEYSDAYNSCIEGSEIALQRALRFLQSANKDNPEEIEYKEAIAKIYWQRLEAAEANQDHFQITHIEEQLRELNLESVPMLLEGIGKLKIVCTPPAEKLSLRKLEEEWRVLTPNDEELNRDGKSEQDLSIPMGSYEVKLSKTGFKDIVAPVLVSRGKLTKHNWQFRTDEEVGVGFIQIPSGTFRMGGDPQGLNSVESTECNLEDFAMAEFPVTWLDYTAYLEALADSSMEKAQEKFPKLSSFDKQNTFRFDDNGKIQYGDGNGQEDHWPIFNVTHQDALDYCAWKSNEDGKNYRLPTDQEWEKAARGVDSRFFPWGSQFDASFCSNANSQEGASQPENVGSYPIDKSPYGIRDMAGGIREWCSDWMSKKDQHRLVRGGSWNFGEVGARCTYRLGCPASLSFAFIGFRLVHSYGKD